MNDSAYTNHPEELLNLHALHALEGDDERALQVHLDTCAACRRSLALKLQIAAMLGQMVEQQPPPAGLQARVMQAVARAGTQPTASGPPVRHVIARASWIRLAMPVAASFFAVVLTASLVMHYFTVNRLELLEEENLALAERLTVALAAAAQEREDMGRLKAANHMIADPDTSRLQLEPMGGVDAPSHGVLLLSEDGRHVMLLLAGMVQPAQSETYQVWLMRSDRRVPIGSVEVDASGSATASLAPQESVFGFDWLALSTTQDTGKAPTPESLVLRTRITPGRTGR
jgi:hypothetical protein